MFVQAGQLLQFRDRLMLHARRLCPHTADAEDLVQETLIRFTTTYAQNAFPSEKAVMAWLTLTLSRVFIDQCRRARLREHPAGDALPELSESLAHPPEHAAPLYAQVSSEQFAQAVNALSPGLRQAYQLHAAGRSNQEIAQQLGIQPGAVAKRLFDARVRLRDLLGVTPRPQEESRLG